MGYKKNWIKSAIKRPGALTKKAKSAGKSVQAFMKSYKGKNKRTLRQIDLAKTLNKLRGGK